MSQTVKETSLAKIEKNKPESLLKQLSSGPQIDEDFTGVEDTPCELVSYENNLETINEAAAETVKVAQHYRDTESRTNTEDVITSPEWERGLSLEQQYWEQGPVAKNKYKFQPKYPTCQRLTIKEYGKINNDKKRNKDPSHFKFDFPTTVVLKILQGQKHAGPYHNIIGKGSNSVVIHADYPQDSPWIRHHGRSYCEGVAVKVYKLSNDVDKNNAIFKRVQREATHLRLLRYYGVPDVIHQMKNVIVTEFEGEDQETTPNISSVPSIYYNDFYQHIVKDMDMWYKKVKVVHGKLCMKNIIVAPYRNSFTSVSYLPNYLGWSHSVKTDHPQALVKLFRDCQFVSNFFKMRGVHVKSAEELYKDITELDEISCNVRDAMQKKDLWQKKCLTNPNRESQQGNNKNKYQ